MLALISEDSQDPDLQLESLTLKKLHRFKRLPYRCITLRSIGKVWNKILHYQNESEINFIKNKNNLAKELSTK